MPSITQFQHSPGIFTSETDITASVPAVATSTGAFVGTFQWGPVRDRILVDSETTLKSRFGGPNDNNFESWFTAANFLGYSNQLHVVRAANTTGNSSVITNTTVSAVASSNIAAISNTMLLTATVINNTSYANAVFDTSIYYVGKWPGTPGNSLKVSRVDTANAYQSTITLAANSTVNATSSVINFTTSSNAASVVITPSGTGNAATTLAVANTIAQALSVGDLIAAGNSTIGTQYLKVTSIGAVSNAANNGTFNISFATPYTLSMGSNTGTFTRTWEYFGVVDRAPGISYYQSHTAANNINDEVHIVISDEDGYFTGTPGTVLEVFEGLSRASDAKYENGASSYYKTVLANGSKYLWAGSDQSGAATGLSTAIANSTNLKPYTASLSLGQDGLGESSVPFNVIAQGYDLFNSPEAVDISIVMQGKAIGGTGGTGLANYITSNITETRTDCVVCISPQLTDVVGTPGNELTNLTTFRGNLTSSSFGIMDSGYKYQYDKYNDTYRWVPLNGDIAGIIARTDTTNDPWWSPAGFTRGVLKNVIKLAYNPGQADRDILWKADINSVTSLPGKGPILYGDKTLLGRNSAFSRINVRRLFITLRKAISQFAQSVLFEFNDSFTQAQFVNTVDPYLRAVQSARGITAYEVICDGTNNTPEVVDNEGFVAQIYVSAARAIDDVSLGFVSTPTGIQFSEIVGRF
jgi:hypothetical protein